jgi:hypothetical protein
MLIDCSAPTGAVSAVAWRARLERLKIVLPKNAQFRLFAVNYTTRELTDGVAGFDKACQQAALLDAIDEQGGVAPHQAVLRGVTQWRDQPIAEQRVTVPVFVLLKRADSEPVTIGSLQGVEQLTPDVPGYWVDDGQGLTMINYRTGEAIPVDRVDAPSPVVFPLQDRAACALPGQAAVLFDSNFDGVAEFSDSTPKARYVAGQQLWARWYDTTINPSLLDQRYRELVRHSRAASVMLPVTSFMVVENSAQEAMLERKHREGANADSALEFDEHLESPEPSLWLLLIPVFLFIPRKEKNADSEVL